MMCTNEQLRAAYALNLCTVSVAQIIDYNDIGILMQEYDNILNNLNMEAIPKNNALREALVQILDTIKLCKISEGDRKLIDSEYQNRMKNAVWSAVPHLGLIFATGNPIAIAMNLATQVGIGYMNYRRNRAEYQQGQEKEYWQIQKSKLDMFSNLQQMLFETAWRLADTFNFPDEYRLTDQQVHEYNNALLEDNPIKRYNNLDFMKDKFKAYPHFWYQMGSTANSIYRSENLDISDSMRTMYKERAIECFEHYRNLNKFNLLRHDAITSAWALEYIDLLDLNDENDRAKARELLGEAEAHAGNANDALELCAYADLKLGCYDDAVRLFKTLVNRDYNAEVNARILSALLIYNSRDPEKRDNALFEYAQLPMITKQQYLLPMPSTEDEWKNWKPDWAKDEVSADAANEGLTEGNSSVASSGTAADMKSDIAPSESAEDAMDRIIGWAAKNCEFISVKIGFYSKPIAVYETQSYYLIVYQPNRYDCPHNMQQIRVNKKNGSVAFFGLDTRAEKVMYESDIYDGQTYISDARQREYYSVDDDLYCGCSEGLLKISLDTMKYEKIELQAQNKYDSWKISGCGNKIVLVYNGDQNKIYIYDINTKSAIRLVWNENIPAAQVDVCAQNNGLYILARNWVGSEVVLYNYDGEFITSLYNLQDKYNNIYHVENEETFYLGAVGQPFIAKERIVRLNTKNGVQRESELDISTDDSCSLLTVARPYPDCLMYVAKGGIIKEVNYQSGNVREIAEGAIYVWNMEKKHFLKKEIERCTVNEDFLRVGQYVYFYQGGNNGATSGPLMKASLLNPGSVQVVRLYDSLEEAGLA